MKCWSIVVVEGTPAYPLFLRFVTLDDCCIHRFVFPLVLVIHPVIGFVNLETEGISFPQGYKRTGAFQYPSAAFTWFSKL